LWVLVPLAIFLAIWSVLSPELVTQSVLASPEANLLPEFDLLRNTLLAEARAVALGASQGVFNPAAAPLIEPYREASILRRPLPEEPLRDRA
ncbi:MAG: phosphate ABC transporter permease family protein, partial [Parachlamydiaceae bacterium]